MGGNPAVDALISSKTVTFNIPWSTEADPTCPPRQPPNPDPMGRASDGNCYTARAFNIVFDGMVSVTGGNVNLPNQIIFGVAYNTQNWGYSPIDIPGPYNSLNVGMRNSAVPCLSFL